MSKIKIVKDTNPKLRSICAPVNMPLSKVDKAIINNMLEYLKLSQDDEYAKNHNIRSGVGLAAPQIGDYRRFFVVYFSHDNVTYEYAMVNPTIVEESAKLCCLNGGEGCLSVDKDHEGLVHRHYFITINAYDAVSEKEVSLKLEGYPAIVFQHEYDHLDGKLFYDHIDKFNPFVLKQDEVKI